MVILTQKQFEAELNKVYDHAYDVGFFAGRQEGVMSRYTVNEIREIFGLEPIEEEENYEKFT